MTLGVVTLDPLPARGTAIKAVIWSWPVGTVGVGGSETFGAWSCHQDGAKSPVDERPWRETRGEEGN
jgi:hypothetical protein